MTRELLAATLQRLTGQAADQIATLTDTEIEAAINKALEGMG